MDNMCNFKTKKKKKITFDVQYILHNMHFTKVTTKMVQETVFYKLLLENSATYNFTRPVFFYSMSAEVSETFLPILSHCCFHSINFSLSKVLHLFPALT